MALEKIAPRLEAWPSVTSSTYADSATLSYVMWNYCAIVMAPKDLKLSKQGTDSRKKHLISIIPQKLEGIRLESDESKSVVMASCIWDHQLSVI